MLTVTVYKHEEKQNKTVSHLLETKSGNFVEISHCSRQRSEEQAGLWANGP